MILDDAGTMALQLQVNLFIRFYDCIAPVYEYAFNFNVCTLKRSERYAQAHLNVQFCSSHIAVIWKGMVQQVSTLCHMVIWAPGVYETNFSCRHEHYQMRGLYETGRLNRWRAWCVISCFYHVYWMQRVYILMSNHVSCKWLHNAVWCVDICNRVAARARKVITTDRMHALY